MAEEPEDPTLVSVVIPTYQRGTALRRAVDSALHQTHSRIEVLVVDDGSTDGSLDLLPGDDDRLRVLRMGTNSGSPSLPRNIGIRESTGAWIAFLDSDDVWHPEKLAWQIRFARSTGAGAVACNATRVTTNPLVNGRPYFKDLPGTLTVTDLVSDNRVITSSMVVERSTMQEAYPFPEVGPTLYEDLAVWLRVVSLTSLRLIPSTLVDYADDPAGSFRSHYLAHTRSLANTFSDFRAWRRENGLPLTGSERLALAWTLSKARVRSSLPVSK